MAEYLYFAMLAALFTHELDAVKRHEWRVLPLTSFLRDQIGEQAFIWAHVPLFAIVLIGGDGDPGNVWRIGLAVFAVVHVGLHFAFRKHPAYEFNNVSSWGLIILAGGLGAVYLLVHWV